MADLSQEDLRFVLSIDPDIARVNRALLELGRTADQAGKHAGANFFQGLSSAGKDFHNLLSNLLAGAGARGGRAGGLVAGAAGGAAMGLRELQGPLGPLGLGFDAAGGALKTLSKVFESIPYLGNVLGPLTQALTIVPSILKDITSTLIDFAGKANPGVFYLWQRALLDVQGVIGRAFVPVLELVTQGVRLFGDVLANILPSTAEVRSALREAYTALAGMGSELRSILAEIGPALRQVFIEGLRDLSHWLAVAARAVVLLSQRLRQAYGGGAAPASEARSAFNAAAGGAGITTLREYQRQSIISAANIGLAGPVDPIAKMDQIIGSIDKEAAQLVASLEKGWQDLREVFKEGTAIAVQSLEALRAISSAIIWIRDRIGGFKDDPTVNKVEKVLTNSLDFEKERRKGRVLYY